MNTYATCHTAGCENQDVPIDLGERVPYVDPEGNEYPLGDVVCGPCGQLITDLTETDPQADDSPDDGAP